MIRILIVDDHPLVADGIEMMLKDEGYLKITATASSAEKALIFLHNEIPEIILLDISLPDMDGLQLCQKIRQTNKYSKIIALTSANDVSIIRQFLHRGGNGYLLKNMERHELLEAIEKVLDGKTYLSKGANDKLLEQFHNISDAITDVPVLTRREKEILDYLNEGLTGPQISERLFLSPYTVETHRKNLMQKLKATSIQLLLKTARDHKLIH